MTNHFRTLVQGKLNLIADLESGEIVSDELIEEGKYYFGYRVRHTGVKFNLDYSNKHETIMLTGYLSTKGGSLVKLDKFTDEIVKKLSELRIICTYDDVSTIGSKVRKVLITGYVNYDNLDGLLK